jgi:Lar family restriction alleviation protein
MEHELKPCPFCGGTALVYTQQSRYNAFAYIQCDTCSTRSKTVPTPYEYDDDRFWGSEAFYRIVRAWNRRSDNG